MAVETRIMNCIMCPLGCEMTVTIEDGAVTSVTGNTCPRGPKYAHDEVVAPKRMLTSTVQVKEDFYHYCPSYLKLHCLKNVFWIVLRHCAK